MREFNLKYGTEELNFSIPAEQLLQEIIGKEYPPVADIPQAVRTALATAIDSPPLREIVKPGEKVVIAVSDVTRAWQQMPLVLPEIIATLNQAGVPDGNITIIIAVGGHRQNTREEFVQLCGQDICQRIKVINHDAWDEDNMVYLGKTSRGTEVAINKLAAEADRLILTGGIVYHYMAGYGGGRKSVVPGISSIKTIRQNHLWGLGAEEGSGSNPNAASRKTKGNELHEDMMEVAGFVQPDFIINMVPTPDGQFGGIFAGNWVSAWKEGCKLVDQLYGVEIDNLADIVIATAGGFPKDINLYQTGKTMDNSCYAVKKGGAVIILSECSDIYEPQEFSRWFQFDDKLAMEKALRKAFGIPGWVALKEVECSDYATYILVTRAENAGFLAKTSMIPATTMEEALRIAKEKCGTDKPTYTVMPQGANTLPILR
ncbi:nickel-dependent lactate racemase [Sporomusa sp.]|uniref:nickel-dependent lactate racemase n=1 Tax=Sporomusa sp. TaxID=2078658 RepID=UPI002D17B018|nr:nickel-dependent lactate racemase [Sporomusa sp.]HWR06558.1 nickel-dependent lactate racemase [Sporomusa sp.]